MIIIPKSRYLRRDPDGKLNLAKAPPMENAKDMDYLLSVTKNTGVPICQAGEDVCIDKPGI